MSFWAPGFWAPGFWAAGFWGDEAPAAQPQTSAERGPVSRGQRARQAPRRRRDSEDEELLLLLTLARAK